MTILGCAVAAIILIAIGGLVGTAITLHIIKKPRDKAIIIAGLKNEVQGSEVWVSFADLYFELECSPKDMPVLREVMNELLKKGYLESDGPTSRQVYRHKQKQSVHS